MICCVIHENLGHYPAASTLDVYGHVTERMKRSNERVKLMWKAQFQVKCEAKQKESLAIQNKLQGFPGTPGVGALRRRAGGTPLASSPSP